MADVNSFINLETLKNLDLALAAGLVFILLSVLRYIWAEDWKPLYDRIATAGLSIGLVELSVFLNAPSDPSYYVAGVINAAIVTLAVIKAKDAEVSRILRAKGK